MRPSLMTRTLTLVVALGVACPGSVVAQTPVTVAALQDAVAKLGRLVPPDQAQWQASFPTPEGLRRFIEETERAERFNAAVTWLRNNAAKSDPRLVSPEYVRSLERAATVTHGGQNAAAVEDVTRELEAKVKHCKQLGVGMGGSVALSVNTRRGSAVVGDWQVFYLLKFDEWLKTPPRTFPRVSSPTDARVEPGRYWVWARDPATGRTSDRMLVEVAGRAELLVDLPVP
jgi:hypothetical protein